MSEIEIITQLGIGGVGMYLLWRIADKISDQNKNHLVHIQESLNKICATADANNEILKDIRDSLGPRRWYGRVTDPSA